MTDNSVLERFIILQDRRNGFNILRLRYVSGYSEQYATVHLVVQAMRKLYTDYGSLVLYAPTVAKASARMLLALAASIDLPLATEDVFQAYMSVQLIFCSDKSM